MSQQFRAHPIYILLTLLLLILAGLLVWGMRDAVTLGELLFLGITLTAAGYFIVALTTSLTLAESAIHLHYPLRLWRSRASTQSHASPVDRPEGDQQIAFRQLISVERAGRLLPVLTLLYHPIQANGLVDIDQIAQVTLPMVANGDELQERLEAVVPVSVSAHS